MARLDTKDSVYQIKKTLEKPEIGPSDGLITKCKIAKAEHPSVFCLHPGNDSSFVTDEDDDVEEDKEAPLEGGAAVRTICRFSGSPRRV